MEHVADIFRAQGADIYYIELAAPLSLRLKRNETENRLTNKPSKRDRKMARQRLLEEEAKYRLESYEGELPFENYMRIDNSDLSPEAAAAMIREQFEL